MRRKMQYSKDLYHCMVKYDEICSILSNVPRTLNNKNKNKAKLRPALYVRTNAGKNVSIISDKTKQHSNSHNALNFRELCNFMLFLFHLTFKKARRNYVLDFSLSSHKSDLILKSSQLVWYHVSCYNSTKRSKIE
jgi:hypothetical protein